MNESRICSIYTQWILLNHKKNEIFHLPVNGCLHWMFSSCLENIVLSEVSQAQLRSSKIACSPSYADYRSKTNAVKVLDMGHTLRGECAQEG
jgi:hypothetical protein